MRRLITLAIACITAISLSGCIIVPGRHGGYYNDHYDRSDRGDHRDHRGDRR